MPRPGRSKSRKRSGGGCGGRRKSKSKSRAKAKAKARSKDNKRRSRSASQYGRHKRHGSASPGNRTRTGAAYADARWPPGGADRRGGQRRAPPPPSSPLVWPGAGGQREQGRERHVRLIAEPVKSYVIERDDGGAAGAASDTAEGRPDALPYIRHAGTMFKDAGSIGAARVDPVRRRIEQLILREKQRREQVNEPESAEGGGGGGPLAQCVCTTDADYCGTCRALGDDNKLGHKFWDEVELKKHGWVDAHGTHCYRTSLPDEKELLRKGYIDKHGRLTATGARLASSPPAAYQARVPPPAARDIRIGRAHVTDYVYDSDEYGDTSSETAGGGGNGERDVAVEFDLEHGGHVTKYVRPCPPEPSELGAASSSHTPVTMTSGGGGGGGLDALSTCAIYAHDRRHCVYLEKTGDGVTLVAERAPDSGSRPAAHEGDIK